MAWRFGVLFLAACAGKIDGTALCGPTTASEIDAAAPMQTTETVPDAAMTAPPPTTAPQCTTSADCDGQLCASGKCVPCTDYVECFGDPGYGAGFFCFAGRCRSLACSNENSPCAIEGRECCNLGDGTLACVVGTCCNDAQCSAPESCQNHMCQ